MSSTPESYVLDRLLTLGGRASPSQLTRHHPKPCTDDEVRRAIWNLVGLKLVRITPESLVELTRVEAP